MDFNLNADQQAFADSARALFADYCSDEQLRAHDSGGEPFMRELWSQCIANGLHGVLIGEAQGGLGMGMTELLAVLQEQGRALALVPLWEHQLAAASVQRFAPALADAVAEAAEGRTLLTLSLDALSAARGASLRATPAGATWRIDGVAPAVPLGAQAQEALLPVQVGGALRLVLLDLSLPGITCIEGRTQHHLAVADLRLQGVTVTAEALLDEAALAWVEPRAVACLAALQLGVSTQQLLRTVQYVSERKQFGRVVGSFQLVAGQMADGHIACEALRSALAQLVYRIDAGRGCQAQALAVKVLAADAGHLVGHKAQHVHGGIGVDLSYPIHRFLYWSRALGITLGGSEPALQQLGDWLADHDTLGWKYDLPDDLAAEPGAKHAV
ncbi:MAG: acyl-CoA/acyl-ACP dehydrogenase [Betaproteobacteria bacterium]|nr:acyl-CoA/acyl-ACP dehydrogenase [Betaproteobacteria bacterium]